MSTLSDKSTFVIQNVKNIQHALKTLFNETIFCKGSNKIKTERKNQKKNLSHTRAEGGGAELRVPLKSRIILNPTLIRNGAIKKK